MEKVTVSEANVRAVLKAQAQAMPRAKLPRAGTTKKLAGGKFGEWQEMRLSTAIALRKNRSRWLRGDFTPEEIAKAHEMMASMAPLAGENVFKKFGKRVKGWFQS